MNVKNSKLCISGVVVAAYVAIVYLTQSISFGQFQVRIATSIYSLVYLFDFLCLPLALANMLSNFLFGSMGILDTIGGFLIGLITTRLICVLKKQSKNTWVCCLPIAIAPSFVVPIWLHYILNIKYFILVAMLVPGQTVACLMGKIVIIPVAKLVQNAVSVDK